MSAIKISDVLIKDMVMLDVEPYAEKNTLFQDMSKRFAENGIVTDAEAFYDALMAREGEGSTYMGEYLALPHGICDEVVRPGVGFCRMKTPMLYKSNGEEGEVKYVFMMAIAGDAGRENHLRILAMLARMLAHEEVREVLGTTTSYEDMLSQIEALQIV